MENSKLILVSDNFSVIQEMKSFADKLDLALTVYSMAEWEGKGAEPGHPEENTEEEGRVLPFQRPASGNQVCTMNEIESIAIRDAVFKFHGNLTEASKALGIGRATLYRKVKQYNIDPSEARRRRSAA